MQQAEMSKAQAAQAKNELEAYIISTQGRLGGDEEVQAVTTDKQREAFQTELSEVEEWLYDQGEHEQASVFRCVDETKQMKASRKPKQMKPNPLIATKVAAQDDMTPVPSVHSNSHASQHTDVSAACVWHNTQHAQAQVSNMSHTLYGLLCRVHL